MKTRILLKLFVVLMAWPGLAGASSGNALKRYEAGKYDSALREYKRLLLENPDDPRLHFNAGAAAFQAKDFEQAHSQLNAALVTQDLQLQERTYYNLGNTEYRLGAEATAPEKKQANWEEAIGHYESALKLNPNDQDAKFNLDLVKKQLEELRKQQQQQSKDDQKDQSKKDDQSKEKDQSPQDKQQQQQKDEQQKQQDKTDQQKSQPEQNQDDKKQEDQQADKKQDDKEQQHKQAQQGKDSKDKENPEEQQAQASKAVIARMTPEQARQLLDAQRADEKTMIFIPKLKTNRVDRVFKDW